MKKFIYLLLCLTIALTVAGCGSTSTSTGKTLKMADFTQAYTDAGVKVDTNEKQAFSMVYAKDGVIFYMDNDPVKIYEYSSTKELDKAKKDFVFVNDWLVNGLFALETDNDKAKEIFKNVK